MNSAEQAAEAARHFIQEETQFHLGDLVTEQSHPLTHNLSTVIQQSVESGVSLLLQVDQDILPVFSRVALSREMLLLEEAMLRTIRGGGRIIFSSCGASGRLVSLLEAMWRRCWEGDPLADRVISLVTGGERALIRAVERFEDFQSFGRRQAADAGIQEQDLMIALTEGGEISSVIGTMKEAADRGARVFMLFNNPADLLRQKFQRSRDVLDDSRMVKMDLTTGPMALSGSTRMQATTIGMLVTGTAMDQVCRILKRQNRQPESWYISTFVSLLAKLRDCQVMKGLTRWVSVESELYQAGGRLTYLTDHFLLDVFSDTTERTPTFMIPPIRPAEDRAAPVPWTTARNPLFNSDLAWRHMLRRQPRGLNWTKADYLEMGAGQAMVEKLPPLDAPAIQRFQIGNEPDPDGSRENDLHLLILTDHDEAQSLLKAAGDRQGLARMLAVKVGSPIRHPAESIHLPLTFHETTIHLFEHLAMKMILNTVSTATMAKIGRVKGNWMIQVDATNKKLIDRAVRIIQFFSHLTYEQACMELHQTIFQPETDRLNFENSYVLQTLRRISYL